MLAVEGETVSGDLYLIRLVSDGAWVAAVDGLGHGPEAAASAKMAIATLENADEAADIVTLVRKCHDMLRGMRGVVMSLAVFSQSKGTMTWIGIGNVEGRLFRANQAANTPGEMLLLRGGIVGHNLPALIAITVPIYSGDTLIFASDGIRNDFDEKLDGSAPPQKLVSDIIAHSAKETDDSLVVVARYC